MRRYVWEFVVCLCLVVLTLVAFGDAFSNGFLSFDDWAYVTQNDHVKAGLSRESLKWAWTTTEAGIWNPLVWMSLELDAELYGIKPEGFHATNVLLHVLNVVLLFLVLRGLTGAVWPGALAAALFAVHPLAVESVAWVPERKNVLSTLFWMLTLAAYTWYAARPGWGRLGLVVLAFALGLTAKPMLVTLPFVLLLLDFWPLRRLRTGRPVTDEAAKAAAAAGFAPASPARLVLEKVPLFVLTAASCAVAIYGQRETGALGSLQRFPLGLRLENAIVSYARYLGQTVWPLGLSAFYPLPRAGWPASQIAAAAALLIGITAVVLWLGKRRPYLPVGWLWFVGTLVPVIGLVQIGRLAMGDRYMYVPIIGLLIMASWGLAEVAARWRAEPFAAVAAAGVLVPLVLLTRSQVECWHDDEALWEHAVAVAPDNAVAHDNLGAAYAQNHNSEAAIKKFREAIELDSGESLAHLHLGEELTKKNDPRSLAEAVGELTKALEGDPTSPKAQTTLGAALEKQGKTDEALKHYTAAVEHDPRYALAHLNLGRLAAMRGDPAGAERHYRAYLDVNGRSPSAWGVWFQLGRILGQQGKWAEAADCFREAAQRQPDRVVFRCHLAYALGKAGREQEAREEYRLALDREPSWPDSFAQQARMLATGPDAKKAGPMAVELAEQACQAAGDRNPRLWDTLGVAYANVGRYRQAAEAARKGLRLANDRNQTELAGAITERLRRYEKSAEERTRTSTP